MNLLTVSLGYLLLFVPIAYTVAAAIPAARPRVDSGWFAGFAFVLASFGSAAWFCWAGGDAVVAPLFLLGRAPALRVDAITATVLPLVTFVGLVIVRYSRRYLHGEPGVVRYRRWLMATLAAVSTVVLSNNLLVFAVGWIATSLTLHQLLTFYPQRPAAVLAAHKKFIASRLADACVLSAVAILGFHAESLELDAVHDWASSRQEMPSSAVVASVLLVMGAALKCAQLPFHGWLLQVMEAPTPVSALLHAGIVNLGGLLMLRLAPFMVRMELAQTLLVLVGTCTAVLAALIVMTRVSAKVALAWSTCAQMGFMLVQCGLGAYHMALLHLLAHSLYKAHAFLFAGSVVDAYRDETLLGTRRVASGARVFAATLCVLGGAAVVWQLARSNMHDEPRSWALLSVMAFAVCHVLIRADPGSSLLRVALSCAGLVTVYFGLHLLFAGLVQVPGTAEVTLGLRAGLVMTGAAALFVVQLYVLLRPNSEFTLALFRRLFAGLYLDEWFTGAVLRAWPPRDRQAGPPLGAVVMADTKET